MMEGAETYRYKSHHMAPLERHQTGAETAFLTLSSSQVKISSCRRDGGERTGGMGGHMFKRRAINPSKLSGPF